MRSMLQIALGFALLNVGLIGSACELPKDVLVLKQAPAINTVGPVYPEGCRCTGVIKVRVLVDEKGNVTCARALNGHPLLRKASEDAARREVFRPHRNGSKVVPFVTMLRFTFA